MIWEQTTADVYRVANSQTDCWNLPWLAEKEGGLAPMSEIARFWRGKFLAVEDLDYLSTAYIVRYKPNSDGKAGWQYSGAANYTVEEYAEAVRKGEMDVAERKDILELVESLKEGPNRNIVLTTVLDNSLGVRVIVDGIHRATALALMRRENPSELEKLLLSTYQILMIELRSRWAHVLYPFDFLNLCAQRGP